jgi:nucleotide-binding universal stress UspA family protein
MLAFGDDRSEGADQCWDWILSHRWNGWSLEVVTADPPRDLRPVSEKQARLHPWEPNRPRQPGNRGFDSVSHLRAEVDPRLALIDRSWDLVAIGPRGSGMLKRIHLGSTADWLLREPASPLLVARQPGPVRNVLVAADGSAHASRAIDTLARLPLLDGVDVRVLAVDDGLVDIDLAAKAALERLSRTTARVETMTRVGSPTETVIDVIDETVPDLVVMGARGEGGFRRLVLGSTTAAVAGSTDRSLLVAHAVDSVTGQ